MNGIFLPGKIYISKYMGWKRDSAPLIFILYSDANITHAINIHYLSQPLLVQLLNFLKMFNKKFFVSYQNLGRAMYNIMKRNYPYWVKTAYRTYKTSMLNGYLINEGVTQPVATMIPKVTNKDLIMRDQMAKAINENLKNSSTIEAKMPAQPNPIQYIRNIVEYKRADGTKVEPSDGNKPGPGNTEGGVK